SHLSQMLHRVFTMTRAMKGPGVSFKTRAFDCRPAQMRGQIDLAAPHGENGLSKDTPVREMSATLRVTSVSPCTLAVAARSPSISGKGSGTLSRAQASAIDSSIGSTRSASLLRICANHRSSDACLFRIAPSFQFDATTYFGDDYHARSNLRHRGS